MFHPFLPMHFGNCDNLIIFFSFELLYIYTRFDLIKISRKSYETFPHQPPSIVSCAVSKNTIERFLTALSWSLGLFKLVVSGGGLGTLETNKTRSQKTCARVTEGKHSFQVQPECELILMVNIRIGKQVSESRKKRKTNV